MGAVSQPGHLVPFCQYIDDLRQEQLLIPFLKGFVNQWGVKWPTMYYHYKRASGYIFTGEDGVTMFFSQASTAAANGQAEAQEGDLGKKS